MAEAELQDLSAEDLPEVGPQDKDPLDYVVVSQGTDGRFGWARKDGRSDQVVEEGGQSFATEAEAVDEAVGRHPDLTIKHEAGG